jgi:hypothetical protein
MFHLSSELGKRCTADNGCFGRVEVKHPIVIANFPFDAGGRGFVPVSYDVFILDCFRGMSIEKD